VHLSENAELLVVVAAAVNAENASRLSQRVGERVVRRRAEAPRTTTRCAASQPPALSHMPPRAIRGAARTL